MYKYAARICLCALSASLAFGSFSYQLPELARAEVSSQENVVSDDMLRMRLNYQVFERDGESPITASDMASLSYLDLTGVETDDWSFLQYATNLEELLLANSNFEDAHLLENKPELKRLVLAHTATQHLEVLSGLTKLETLDLSEMSAAEDAHAGHNHSDGHDHDGVIDASYLKNLVKLKDLRLLEMEIENASELKSLVNLEVLDVSHSLEFDPSVLAYMNKLQDLQIEGTETSDLSLLKDMVNLHTLRANGCGIEDISSLAGLSKLEYLELAHNPIEDISALKELKALKKLDLNRGEMEKVKIKDISALAEHSELVELNLNYNAIESLEPLAQNQSLTHLFVSGNKLKSLKGLEHLDKLISLEASRNEELSDVSALKDLQSLEGLQLNGDAIKDFRPVERLLENTFFSATEQLIQTDPLPVKESKLLRPFASAELKLEGVELKDYPQDAVLFKAGEILPESIGLMSNHEKVSFVLKPSQKELAPSMSLSKHAFEAEEELQIVAEGFLPGEDLELYLHSEPHLVARLQADENGALNYSFSLPKDMHGSHTLELRSIESGFSLSKSIEIAVQKKGMQVGLSQKTQGTQVKSTRAKLPQTSDLLGFVTPLGAFAVASLALAKKLGKKN